MEMGQMLHYRNYFEGNKSQNNLFGVHGQIAFCINAVQEPKGSRGGPNYRFKNNSFIHFNCSNELLTKRFQ